MDQIVIKVLLIAAFLIFAFVLIRAASTARSQAIRTISLLIFLVAAILAVIFPGIVNDLAVAVGVGRGADLLLYAFIIVFIGNALSTTRRRREQDRQITELARQLAIVNAKLPETVAVSASDIDSESRTGSDASSEK